MRRLPIFLTALSVIVALVGAANARKELPKPTDELEGVLRVHPKFHYRYYIDGFGDGQQCGLFQANETLKQLEPGTRIRVRGDLKSKFFGNPKDKTAALVSTWIIYMDVDDVEVLRQRSQ